MKTINQTKNMQNINQIKNETPANLVAVTSASPEDFHRATTSAAPVKRRGVASTLACLLALAGLLGAPLGARATTLVVTNLADSGPGTLRAAIAIANTNAGGADITFGPTLGGQTITLTSGQLTLSNQLTLTSPAGGLYISGNHNSRVFEVVSNAVVTLDSFQILGGKTSGSGGGILVDDGATLTIRNSTLYGNSASGAGGGIENSGTLILRDSTVQSSSAGGNGGGIDNHGTLTGTNCTIRYNSGGYGGGIYSRGTAKLDNSTLSHNFGIYGGGIANDGMLTLNNSSIFDNSVPQGQLGGGIYSNNALTLNNCTLSGNSATNGNGGGVFNFDALTINNCTLSVNSASQGGGIFNGGTLAFTNTIVAGNTAATDPNFYNGGTYSSLDNFLVGDPQLAPLGNYGGPTQTMPPLAGSPAIDAGTDSVTNFLTTDQRGYPRLFNDEMDIGAVELQGLVASQPPVLTNPVAQADGALTFDFTSIAGAEFTVLASPNLALPLSQWSNLGLVTQGSPGQYQFTDPGAANYPQRFYQVVSP